MYAFTIVAIRLLGTWLAAVSVSPLALAYVSFIGRGPSLNDEALPKADFNLLLLVVTGSTLGVAILMISQSKTLAAFVVPKGIKAPDPLVSVSRDGAVSVGTLLLGLWFTAQAIPAMVQGFMGKTLVYGFEKWPWSIDMRDAAALANLAVGLVLVFLARYSARLLWPRRPAIVADNDETPPVSSP